MADSKLSALTELASGALVDADEFYVHDASVADSAASKRITAASLYDYMNDSSVHNVVHHGAVGDGTTSDLAAFDAAVAAASAEDTIYIPATTAGYFLSNGGSGSWAVPSDVNLVFEPGVRIIVNSTNWGDNPVVTFGATGSPASNWRPSIIGFPIVYAGSTQGANTNFTAWVIQDCSFSRIELGRTFNIYRGIELYSTDNQSFHAASIRFLGASECDVALRLRVDGTGTQSWINGNDIYMGACRYRDGATGTRYGVEILRENTPTDDNIAENQIHFAAWEGDTGQASTSVIAYLRAGKRNVITVDHIENVDVGFDLVADQGDTHENVIVIGNDRGDNTTTGVESLTKVDPPATGSFDTVPLNDWYGNVVLTTTQRNHANQWHSGDLAKKASEYNGSGAITIPGIAWRAWNGTTTRNYSPDGVEMIVPDGVSAFAHLSVPVNSYDPVIAIDTTRHKTISLQWVPGEVDAAGTSRVALAAYNADGTQVNPNSTSNDTNRINANNGLDTVGASLGGGWSNGTARAWTETTISVDDTIAYIVISLRDGPIVKSLSISVPPNELQAHPIRVFAPTNENYGLPAITAAPSEFGSYGLGWAGVETDGTNLQICTTAGTCAPAWAISTAYTAGQLVLNDTNKIYVCMTAGTSAGSGGPTGTGTGITDNTVTWDYYDAQAAFTTQ